MEKKNLIIIGILVFLIVIFGKNLGLFATMQTTACYTSNPQYADMAVRGSSGNWYDWKISDGAEKCVSITYVTPSENKWLGCRDDTVSPQRSLEKLFLISGGGININCDWNSMTITCTPDSPTAQCSLVCDTDVKQCPDGSYVGRNPNNNCEFYNCCNTPADTNCDSTVDRAELGTYINSWISGSVSRDALGQAIVAWIG